MDKADMNKVLAPFMDEIEFYVLCNGVRHYVDTVAYEIGKDGEGRLVVQPGPVVPGADKGVSRAVALHGTEGKLMYEVDEVAADDKARRNK